MDRIVEKVSFPIPQQPKAMKVAAYARVSDGKDAMLHSLSAQVSYYSDLIQCHAGWIYVGVYADEALTGTKENRTNFQRMLADCRDGKIDLVITKSISRFARNTVTLLSTVRELKNLGIDVFFEEQNIHTMSAEGELMLTILASYAQEESLSASENQKWKIRSNFQQGIPANSVMLGYRYEKGTFIVVPEEAEIVKRIFAEYLSGKGMLIIQKELNSEGKLTKRGKKWGRISVNSILRNYTYTGNLLLQKTYRKDHITKRKMMNNGELPKYHVQNAHEAIISLETFQSAQAEIDRRSEKFKTRKPKSKHRFTGIITCGNCGKHYIRKTTHGGVVWICWTFNTAGKAECQSKQIPEDKLITLADEVLSDAPVGGVITAIRAEKDNVLVFTLSDGSEQIKRWKDRSRAESWTEEMKEVARQKTLQRRKSECLKSDK